MRKKIDLTLITPQSAVGHWRFRGSLNDDSGAGHHLDSTTLTAGINYTAGASEDGLTMIDARANTWARVPAASAGDFDFGISNFCLEARLVFANSGQLFYKKTPDEFSDEGYYIALNGSGQVVVELQDDVSHFVSQTGTIQINDGESHYISIDVNRTTDLAVVRIDGVSDMSIDISTLTGNIGFAASNFRIGGCGYIDEVCVSLESFTAAWHAERPLGRLIEASAYEEGFLRSFLPAANHDNAQLEQLLFAPTTQFLEIKEETEDLRDLIAWDRCPGRYLSLLAANIGLKLIDPAYATETERRNCIKWASWIFERKGTPAGIAKLPELLGFTVGLTEVFSHDRPFIVNKHKSWDRSLAKTAEFTDDFSGNLSKWKPPINYLTWWRLDGGRLKGTSANGYDDNGLIFADIGTGDLYMAADIEVLAGETAPASIGLYLNFAAANTWTRVELYRDSANDDHIVIRQNNAGTEVAELALATLGTLASRWWEDPHRFWVHANLTTKKFTVGLDDMTLLYNYTFGGAITGSALNKGLWINNNVEAAFDNIIVQTLNKTFVAKTFDPGVYDRRLQVQITGAPAFAQNKLDYLTQVMPEFVPAGVEIEYV